MKNLSPALLAHLGAECSTVAYLIKITRMDGAVRAFTNHDRDLVVGGVTYKADGAFNPSALVSDDKLATDNLAATGMLNGADVTEADLDAGRYDHARVDVFICNWADVSQGVMQLRRGWLGEVTTRDTHYTAELRGMHDLLQREWGDFYTVECRHDLGDTRCTVALGPLTASGSVTSVTDMARFNDTARSEADGWFNYGKLQWTSGGNSGLAVEVKQWNAGTREFTLWLPMPQAIAVGDAYTVVAGCDKRYATCKSKFSNLLHFGGFPHMPGVDKMLQYPDGKL